MDGGWVSDDHDPISFLINIVYPDWVMSQRDNKWER